MTAMRANRAMLEAFAKKHVRSQKGNALLEFALILPLFLTLILGMIFYSIALYDKIIITMAAREGARAGAISSSSGSANYAASSVCDGNLISLFGALTATITPTIDSTTSLVKIQCDYPGFYIFPDISLSARTTMRLELP